MTVITETRRAH